MKLRHILIALLAAGTGIGAFLLLTRATPVGLVSPTMGDAAEIVYATGTVEPRTWAKVTPLVRERIVELCECEGEAITAGYVLARLDSREAETALAELQARLRLAREERQRVIQLVEKHAGTQQALDRAQADVAQLEASIAGQKTRLDQYVLRAPSGGTVLRQDGEVGEIADPSTVLFWVGQLRPLDVIADVNEEDIPRIVLNQKALMRSDAFPGRNLEAVVDRITPMGDPVARTYRVRFRLPDDTPLMIGMSVDVNVIVRVAHNVTLLPSASIEGSAVFVSEDGTARRRTIDVGIRGTRETEVRGLAMDTSVISPFPDGLKEGARVKPEKR